MSDELIRKIKQATQDFKTLIENCPAFDENFTGNITVNLQSGAITGEYSVQLKGKIKK